jgi:hypothetical protein
MSGYSKTTRFKHNFRSYKVSGVEQDGDAVPLDLMDSSGDIVPRDNWMHGGPLYEKAKEALRDEFDIDA